MTPSVEKECRTCGDMKPVDQFYARRRVCKTCMLEERRIWIRENPAEHSRRTRDWQRRNPDKVLDMKLKRKYGMSLADFNALLEAQGGVCAICKSTSPTDPRLSVDHCHATGRVRALLCRPCNTTLGLMAEDPERLERAADYLRSHKEAMA